MRAQFPVTLAFIAALIACTVHDRKLPKDQAGPEEPGSAEAEKAIAPVPPPLVTLSLNIQQVYQAEPITLSWSSENADSCLLKANGEEIPKSIGTSGSDTFHPAGDTDYEISCQSAKGLTATAMQRVKVLGEDDIFLNLGDAARAAELIDLNALAGASCLGAGCIFADLEPSFFTKAEGSGFSATDEFLEKLSEAEPLLPENRSVNLKSITSEFDLASSTVYGAEDRLAELGLSEKCQANFTLEKDQSLLKSYAFSTKIEDGFENLPDAKLSKFNVFVDLQVSGKGRRGTISAGTDLIATYKPVEIHGSVRASFTDFENLKGQFRLPKSVISSKDTLRKFWAGLKRIFSEKIAYAVTFPAGYPVPPPANGYQYNPLHATCYSDVPTIRTSQTYENRTQLCQSGDGGLCCEPGYSHTCPTQWPYTVFKSSSGWPISLYVERVRSLRVVAGPGTVQCSALFPGLVEFYNITAPWVATSPNAQFFVNDTGWPACGGYSCANKVMRTSSTEIVSNVEPSYNHCLDRWKGLNFNTYLSVLQTDCQNTDVFRAASAAKAARDADQSYASACNGEAACKDAILSMAGIRNEFPLETLRKKIEAEEMAINAAKAAGKTYLVEDALFIKTSVQKLSTYITKLSNGLERAESLRRTTTPNADWNGGATIIHQQGIISGFSNFTESKATLGEYTGLKERIAALTDPKAIDVGCNFSASGRFRQYSAADLQRVSLKAADAPGYNVQLKLLQDYMAR